MALTVERFGDYIVCLLFLALICEIFQIKNYLYQIVPVTRLEWASQLNKKQQKSPATIDLPNWNRGKQLEVERVSNFEFCNPTEIFFSFAVELRFHSLF